jgi:hypothetical protein
MRVAAGVLVAIPVLWINAQHIEPSGDAATLAVRAFASICLATLSLFLIASGLKSREAAGIINPCASAGDLKQSEREDKSQPSG